MICGIGCLNSLTNKKNMVSRQSPKTSSPSEGSTQFGRFASPHELYTLAREQDTGLLREQRMLERNQYAINLAQKDYRPDFSVAYMCQQRPDL